MNIDFNSINPNRSDGPKRNINSKDANPNQPVSTNTITTGTNTAKSTSTSDSVSFSSSAQNLAKIEAELKALPEVNQSRVDEVKARIDRGEYTPDSANLAQKMLDLG